MAERSQRRIGRIVTLHQHRAKGRVRSLSHATFRAEEVGLALVNDGHRGIAGIKSMLLARQRTVKAT